MVTTKHGFFPSDIFVLNYYGVFVFFQITKITSSSVFLMELESKPYKNGYVLKFPIKACKTPLVILKNNTYEKSTYEVYPLKLEDDFLLPIEVQLFSPLYNKALEEGRNPIDGIAYAEKVKNHLGKYWSNKRKIKKPINYC